MPPSRFDRFPTETCHNEIQHSPFPLPYPHPQSALLVVSESEIGIRGVPIPSDESHATFHNGPYMEYATLFSALRDHQYTLGDVDSDDYEPFTAGTMHDGSVYTGLPFVLNNTNRTGALSPNPTNLPIPAPTGISYDNTETDVQFRVETKQIFVCTHGICNKRYARLTDLKRHHRGAHEGNDQFKCRARGCSRAIRGFPRRDKRDSHEKSMHMGRAGGFVG